MIIKLLPANPYLMKNKGISYAKDLAGLML